jgi:hypothetical protein
MCLLFLAFECRTRDEIEQLKDMRHAWWKCIEFEIMLRKQSLDPLADMTTTVVTE